MATISTQYGLSPVNFGHADYSGNISAGFTPLQILDYLNQNPNVLKGTNVPGQGGVYDFALKEASTYQQPQAQQTQTQQTQTQQPQTQQQQAAISTEYGLSPVNFGHADYGANISAGFTPLQILDYLNQNPDVIKGTNAPGQGGVYDLALQEASIYQQQQAQQKQFEQQQAAFQQQLADQQQQAQEAQRQLMINMQRSDRAPAAVKTAYSAAEKSGLTSGGSAGYFGRQGLRIGSLNVPYTGLAITPNTQMPVSGSFA